MKRLKQIVHIIFLLVLIYQITGCRKAKTDEEMREMIVGEWTKGARLKLSATGNVHLYFSSNGSFQMYSEIDGDTVFGSGYSIVENKDSVVFSVSNGVLSFSRNLSILRGNPESDYKIIKFNNDCFKLETTNSNKKVSYER